MDQHDTNDERPWLQWDQGHPYSKRYGDRYFDRDGLAESDYVFLRHNDLPARWANRRAFTIGELGFGTGLNACLTLERWRQTAHPDACLDYISVESHPLGADDMRRALAQWPQLGRTADALASACQRLQPGFNLRVLESGRVRLLVLCGDVDRMLEALDAQVDAWYLDGFAPARNPDMWSETVCRLLAARTRSGGSFATYTAAGWVRRNLQAAGYDVCKAPGFGRKRDMLHGHLAKAVDAPAQADAAAKPWFQRPKPAATDHAVVIGAGLAGSATARALAERGLDVTVYDRPKPDIAPPSRLPALIVRPYPERAANLRGRFYDAAFGHAAHRLKQAAGWHPTGVGVIAHRGRLSGQVLDAAGLTQAVGTALQAPGQWLPNAGWLHPTRWTAAWLDHPRIRCLNQPAPDRLADVPTVLATGAAVTDWDSIAPVSRARGQMSELAPPDGKPLPTAALAGGGLCVPSTGTVWVGSSHQRGQTQTTPDADEAASYVTNWLERLGWPGSTDVLTHMAAVRAGTPDRMPQVGPLPDAAWWQSQYADIRHGRPGARFPTGRVVEQRWLHRGHGSRGATAALLCGEIIAAAVTGAPLPVDRETWSALHPGRSLIQALRRA